MTKIVRQGNRMLSRKAVYSLARRRLAYCPSVILYCHALSDVFVIPSTAGAGGNNLCKTGCLLHVLSINSWLIKPLFLTGQHRTTMSNKHMHKCWLRLCATASLHVLICFHFPFDPGPGSATLLLYVILSIICGWLGRPCRTAVTLIQWSQETKWQRFDFLTTKVECETGVLCLISWKGSFGQIYTLGHIDQGVSSIGREVYCVTQGWGYSLGQWKP